MNLPPEFDLHALDAFIMTVELGGMSQCAAHMQITQSAVSQTIAKLEAGIGTPLFDRTMRPLGLTASGKSLFERGQRLTAMARSVYDEVREGANLPIASITVAMSFSLADQLTSPILNVLGKRADRWSIRSGISQEHHGEFLARDIDMLMTGSFDLERRDNVEIHSVFEENFVLALPGDYIGPVDLTDTPPALPFIRFTRLSGMGQQIERQIARMKLRLPHCAEVDSAHQQIATVASGFGWTITSPVCLAAEPELLGGLRLEPMPRGRFARHVQVVARSGELGDIPQRIAELSTQHLSTITFPPLITKYPWLKEQIAWPSESMQKLG